MKMGELTKMIKRQGRKELERAMAEIGTLWLMGCVGFGLQLEWSVSVLSLLSLDSVSK